MISPDTPPEEDPNAPPNPVPGSSVEIEILLSNVVFGPYTVEKVRERLAEDLLAPNDQARVVSSEDWVSLQDLLEQLPVEEVAVENQEPGAEDEQVREEALDAESATETETPVAEVESSAPAEPTTLATGRLAGPTRFFPPQAPTSSVAARTTLSLPARLPARAKVGTGPLPAPPRKTSSVAWAQPGPASLAPPRPNAGGASTRPLGGLRSQILARTSNEPLALAGFGVTRPGGRSISSAPTALPASPAPAPAEIHPGFPMAKVLAPEPEATEKAPIFSPEPSISASGSVKRTQRTTPIFRLPAKFPTSRPKLDEDDNAVPSAASPVVSPEPAVAEQVEAASEPPATEEASVPKISPATRSISVAAFASGVLPRPPKPAQTTPASSADKILTVRLPSRRTQVIKTLPGAPVQSGEVGLDEPAPLAAKIGTNSGAFTSPLPAPSRFIPEKKKSDYTYIAETTVTLAGISPRSGPKSALHPAGRKPGNVSAFAATTPLPGASGKKASTRLLPEEKGKPLSGEPPLPPATVNFGPATTDSSLAMKESTRLAGSTPLVETRRAALKQARKRRERQRIILAGSFFIVVVLLCTAIFHFTGSNREAEKPALLPVLPEATPVKPADAKPAEAPASAVAPVITSPNPPVAVPAPAASQPPAATPANLAPAPAAGASTNAAASSSSPPVAASPSAETRAAPPVLAHLSAGQAAQAKGDYAGAITEFTAAIGLDAKYPQAYSFRAAAYQAKGDLSDALTDANQLLTLDPTNANGFCQRGFLKQSAHDTDGAVADYGRAIQLDPKAYIAFYNRGMILEEKGQPDGAIADYNRALEINPKLAGAFYNRGNAKMDKSDLEGAVADYTTALELNPKIALAACNRGLAEQNLGNFDAAVADYTQGLTLNPGIAMAYYNRGLIQEQRNNLDACIADSTKAIELTPDNAQAYYNRGIALQAKGNLDGAVEDLRKFFNLAPKNVYADYARLYLWIIISQQSHQAEANAELAASLDSSWNAEPAELVSKIGAFLLDRVSETDLLARASSTDPRKDRSLHCEVCYFDGVKKVLLGRKEAAINCFNQCIQTGQKDYCEYILAEAELMALKPG